MQVADGLIQSLSCDNTGSLGAERSAPLVPDCSREVTIPFLHKEKMAFISSTARHIRIHLPHSLSSLFLLPSPSPPPLPVGKEKVGGEREGGRTRQPQTTLWESLSSAFTSLWGSGCYWFSFMCDMVPLT